MPSLTKVQTGFLEPQGPFTLDPGTASAPGLKFSTSAATGMFSPSAGVLGFSTGSTQNALSILANGNVGIGTTNPTTKLHVFDGIARITNGLKSASNSYLQLASSDASNQMFLTFSVNNGNYWSIQSTEQDIDYRPIVLNVSGGNVGIGATNPLSKLDVRSGVITSGSSSSPNGSEILRGFYSAGGEGALTVIGTEYSSGGPVIGYAVKPSTTASGSFLSSTSINVGRTAYVMDGVSHRWYYGSVQTVTENSAVSTSEVMRLTSSGNVGIGTTNPTSKLDVLASTGATAINSRGWIYINSTTVDSNWNSQLRIDGNATYQPKIILASTTGYRWSIRSDDPVGNGELKFRYEEDSLDTVTFTRTGNVGIGTASPSERLHFHAPDNGLSVIRLSGTAVLQIPYNIRQGIVGVSNSGFSIYDVTAAATRFAIDSAGNVGIGISNPSYKLDVNGSIRAYSSSVGTPPYIFLTYDVTPADGAGHGRIAVSKSNQNSYSGKIHLQPQYWTGSTYDYLTNALVVDASGRVGIGALTNADLTVNPGPNGIIPVVTGGILVGIYSAGNGYTEFTVKMEGINVYQNLILEFTRAGTCPGIYVDYSGSAGYQPDHGNTGNAYIQFYCDGGATLNSGTIQSASFAGRTVSWSHGNGTTPVQLIFAGAILTDYTFYKFRCFHGRGYLSGINVYKT